MKALESLMPSPARSEHGFEKMTEQELEQHKCDKENALEGKLHELDGYDCRECRNKGYISVPKQNELSGWWMPYHVDCKCKRIRNAIHRLNRSGLSNVVKECTFDKYNATEDWQTAVKAAAMRFCKDSENKWFFIGGQSGAGKSHLCTAMTVHYIRQGKEAKYMLWRDEITRLKASVNDAPVYADLMHELKDSPVLYIDDLFKSGKGPDGKPAMPTTADVNAAFEIINYRSLNPELITIISSERTLSELEEIDSATAGRIAHKAKAGGYCLSIRRDPAKNYRMKGIQEL